MATNATLKSKRQKTLTVTNASPTASDKNLYDYRSSVRQQATKTNTTKR